MMNENAQAAIHGYVTDMLALEHHIETAIEGQMKAFAKAPAWLPDLERMHETRQVHIEALTALSERRELGGQGIAGAVKKAAASVLGLGAAAVDLVRTEDVPKNLRDDYAAMSLSCVGYLMLHTTALSLGDTEVATMAQRHYNDEARMLMTLQRIIPEAVVSFLNEDGMAARADVLPGIHRSVHAAWTSERPDDGINQLPMADDLNMSRPHVATLEA